MRKYFYILLAILAACRIVTVNAAYVYYNNVRVAGATTNGTSWANAYTSITNITSSAAGDTNCVAFCHDEQQTVMSISVPGTVVKPSIILCTDTNSEPPTAILNTAVCKTVGTVQIAFLAGHASFDGVSFYAGSGSGTSSINFNSNADGWGYNFKNCTFGITNTSASARITVGINGSVREMSMKWENVYLKFGAIGQGITASSSKSYWWNTSTNSAILGTVVPTTLIQSTTAGLFPQWDVRGVNLSAITNSHSLVAFGAAADSSGRFRFSDCRLGASAGMMTGSSSGPGGGELWLVNCDSTDTNYRFYKYNWAGEEVHETTIVKTSGATDGTTPFSRKLTTSANANFSTPLESEWVYGWTDTTGSVVTAGINILTDSYTNYNNEAWLEVESMSTSGFPLGVFANNGSTNIFTTPVIQDLDSSPTWTTTGLSSPIKQTLSVAFTPQQKGWYRGRVKFGRSSTTIYYDPMFTNGFSKAFMSGTDGIINLETPAATSSGGAFTYSH
jgi:hypothetical protein